MGEYDKQPAKQAARASAGPSEDDRFGAGPICTNAEARIIKYDIIDGRLRITIAKGTSHGARDNLPGYIKSGRGMLADFHLEGVRDAVSYAFVPLTPEQLTGHLYVVINPTSFPSTAAPSAGMLASRVIAVVVDSDPPRDHGRTKITLPHGTTDGVATGMRGQLRSENGRALRDFTIWFATANESFAYLREPVDYVTRHPHVVLFPNTVPSRAPIQRRAGGTASAVDVQATAQAGVAGANSRLPHLDVIQRAFGKHDLSGVQAQVGGAAADASAALGAQAYATGDKVAFASEPDLHTAAHEAAHTIQQQRGAVGFQGLGAADDEHEQHADAVADKVVAGESAEQLLDATIGTGTGASARSTQTATEPSVQRKPSQSSGATAQPAGQRWELAAPDKIDLGDNVVDRRTTHRASIFALHRQQGPRVRAALHGDPSVKLISSPMFLPGAGAPYDDANAFQFEHRPVQQGLVTNTLQLEILDAPHETFRYPVVAAAHHAGGPTVAEQRESKDRQSREEREAEDAATERNRVEKRIEADYQRDTHYHAGHYRELEDTRIEISEAIRGLYASRVGGLDAAGKEIGDFVRQPTIVKPSLLEQLAILALDMATAGIAGGLAKRLEAALSVAFKIPAPTWLPDRPRYPRLDRDVEPPTKAIIAFFTDGLKEGVKKSAKLRPGSKDANRDVDVGRGDVGVDPNGDTYAKKSTNPKVAFFELQSDQLAREGAERAGPLSTFTRNALLPTLRTRPTEAIAAMKAVLTSVKAEWEDATLKQTEATVRKWVRYLAESSREGSLDGRFEGSHVPAVDGVVDIAIRPSYRHPERPVEVLGARLFGVKKAVVERIAKQPLVNIDVPVRASGGFDGSPSATLTVVREIGGRIEYTENIGVGSGDKRARWLERKAAANGRGADAEAGARILLERELMSVPLYALLDKVENDSKE